jgi:hypothetical protein
VAVCCVFLFAIPIGLLIGAAILRGAVSLANKCLPKQPARENDGWGDDVRSWDDYDRPRAPALIPEPSMGKAMGIVFVIFIIGIIISIPINIAFGLGAANMGMRPGQQDPLMSLLASLVQLPISFLVNAGVLTGMLPTSFPRACLVVLFQFLVIAVPLVALVFALGK